MNAAHRANRLRKLLSIAESEEQQSGAQAGQSQLRLDQERQRLGELLAYRHDYDDRARQLQQVHAAHWQDYRRFIDRLDQALATQRNLIAECEHNLDVLRSKWMETRQRKESLQRACDRYLEQQRISATRNEQRQNDDLPQRRSPFSSQEH